MADGYARVTGKVGVCEGPSGGGATYILPGLVEANESSVPVLAINTDISVSSRGRFTLTELDQRALMRPLTKWNAVLDRSADIPRVFRAGVRGHDHGPARARRTSRCPSTCRTARWSAPRSGPIRRSARIPSRRIAPDPFHVGAGGEAAAQREAARSSSAAAASVISGAQERAARARRAALCARGDHHQRQGLDRRGACALAVGVVGSNGGTPETRAVVDAGGRRRLRRLPRRLGDHRALAPSGAGAARRSSTSTSIPAVSGANYQVDVPLVGDAKLALAALNEALGRA